MGRSVDLVELSYVAYLSGTRKWDVAVIADHLGEEPSTIRKRISKAVACGLLKKCPPVPARYIYTDSDKRRRGLAKAREPERMLREAIEGFVAEVNHSRSSGARVARAPRVRILLSTPQLNERDSASWDRAVVEFARNGSAATECLRVLQSSGQRRQRVGVAWGRTLYAIVREMIATRRTSRMWAPTFFPMWGEPLGSGSDEAFSKTFPNPSDWSSSKLAADLTVALSKSARKSGMLKPPISLRLVPGVIPLTFNEEEQGVIRRYVYSLTGHDEVFGRSTERHGMHGHEARVRHGHGLIRNCDAMMVSVGTPEQGERWLEAVLEARDYKELLSAPPIGDIGGAFLVDAERTPSRIVKSGTSV